MTSSIRISLLILTVASCLVLVACGGGSTGTAGIVTFDLRPTTRVISVGQTQAYTISATQTDGKEVPLTARECHWEIRVGRDSILTMDDPGDLRGLSAGLATVRVTCGGITRDFDFNVF